MMDSEMKELIEQGVKELRDVIRNSFKKAILVYVIFWFILALPITGAMVYITIILTRITP